MPRRYHTAQRNRPSSSYKIDSATPSTTRHKSATRYYIEPHYWVICALPILLACLDQPANYTLSSRQALSISLPPSSLFISSLGAREKELARVYTNYFPAPFKIPPTHRGGALLFAGLLRNYDGPRGVIRQFKRMT